MNTNCFEKNLETGWKISIDHENIGHKNGWQNAVQADAVEALVPGFICDSVDTFRHGVAWYWNCFDLDIPLDDQCEYYIKAGYTEWVAQYWLNGIYVGEFVGTRLNYELDITSILRPKNNLLAVRIISPSEEGIDGYTFQNIAASARGVDSTLFGGILYPIYIAARPRLRTGRTVVKSDMQNGSFCVSAELINHTESDKTVTLTLTVLSDGAEIIHTEEKKIICDREKTEIIFNGILTEYHLWDIESPYLYTALLTVTDNGSVVHSSTTRFGFREFRVKDGFFFLNNRRVFVKSAHTSIFAPPWKNRPWDKQCLRDELIRTKAMGQNMVRYLSANTFPEILDFCDEIGLMVFQEHAAAWDMYEGNPQFEELFDFHARGVLYRDINHPSFTMFGLVNECHSRREHDCAVAELQRLREVDDSRLILLGSGRWDKDWSVGSVSNPHSYTWECVWGAEGLDPSLYVGKVDGSWETREDELTCWDPTQGDLHFYPRPPMTDRAINILRTHSAGLRPTFLSEGGNTSMGNSMRMIRKAEEAGFGGNRAYWGVDRRREQLFARDFFRYGLDELYGVPEDVPFASYPLNAKQRARFFDCARSNPQICGISYTQALEATSGAGMIMWERDQYKPYMCDAVANALAPLHWCLFVNPTHVYVGKPFTVEAVLASEDVLGQGEYPITAKIVSKEYGKVWEHHTVLTIPELPKCGYHPFSFPVFHETVTIDLPEGDYELTVYMEHGGWPTGGRMTIPVTQHTPLSGVSAAMIGMTEQTVAWLAENGVTEDPNANLLLIGDMPNEDHAWETLYDRVRAGASAVILCPEVLLQDVDNPYNYDLYVPKRLPFENKGRLTYADNWHYHACVAIKAHPYTKGLPKGLADDDYYMQATPQFVFIEQDVPDEVAALSITLGYYTHTPDAYLLGVNLGVYRLGRGRLVLNCFKFFDQYGNSPSHANLGKNPAADRLLLNIISHESEQSKVSE